MVKSIVKKLVFRSSLWRLSGYANRHKSAILMYHGLTDDESCGDWTQIRLTDFRRQMSYIKDHYNVVSISGMLENFSSGKSMSYMAAVTFDDGYRSVFELAWPVLKELALPATIYITSNFIGNNKNDIRYIWPDYVSVLLKSSQLSRIDLSSFGLGSYDIPDPARLRSAVYKICEQMKLISSKEKNNIISYLEDKYLETVNHDLFSAYHPMTWEEVKQLSAHKLISIGAHTRNHPILSRIEKDELEGEILGCKLDIEKRIRIDISDFAYPNGRLIDFNDAGIEIVKKGFRSAVTTTGRLNHPDQNPYLLSRIGIGRNLSIDNFKMMLSGLF